MFADHHQQNLADQLKRLIYDNPLTGQAGKAARSRALNLIHRFESAPWHPRDLEAALNDVEEITFSQGKFTVTGDAPVVLTVARLILRYLERVAESTGEIDPPVDTQLFGSEQAAEYLGISSRTLKYHVQEANLTGQVIGHSRVFTQGELDHFAATRRRQGRPAKQISH